MTQNETHKQDFEWADLVKTDPPLRILKKFEKLCKSTENDTSAEGLENA